MGEDGQELLYSFVGDVSSLSSATQKAISTLDSYSNAIKRTTTKVVNTVKSAVSSLVGLQTSDWLTGAVKQSIEFTENVNLFNVAMGDAVEIGADFVTRMSEIYGMDPNNLLRYAGNFYQLADAIDMPSESAARMSLSLTKMANDISSLFNVPIEQAFNDLSSGMQGMSRAVRKYGMDIRATTLEQTALSLGITANVQQMSEANRQGLRFITMMKQAANASGDFARTIETPANQLRIFKEQVTILGRAIGDLFIGSVTKAISYINGFIMALSTAIRFIGSLLGVVTSVFSSGVNSAASTAEDTADSIDGIASSAGGAAKALKKLLAPFDELNVLQGKASGGGGAGIADLGVIDPAIAEEIANMELKLENIRMKALDVRDALLGFFGFKVEDGTILSWDSSDFESNLINKFPKWTKTIKAVFDNWSKIVESFKKLLDSLGGVFATIWQKVSDSFGKFFNDDSMSNFVENLSSSLSKLATFVETNQDVIADFAIALAALAIAFTGFGAIKKLVEPIVSFVTTCAQFIGPVAQVAGVIALVAAAIALLYTQSESFATSFNQLLASLMSGLVSLFTSLYEMLQVVVSSVLNSMSPALDAIGQALSPVIGTIIELWNDLIDIVTDVFSAISNLWTRWVDPVLKEFSKAVSGLAKAFEILWSEYVGPVIDNIGNGLYDVWKDTLEPILEKVVELVSKVAQAWMGLWNNVLMPFIQWVLSTFAPIFTGTWDAVWAAVQTIVHNIGQAIGGLIDILMGIIDFIVGVFTGDWERAWEGIVGVFDGIWQTLSGIVKTVFNAIIGVINGALGAISGAVNSVIRAVNKIKFEVPEWVPKIGGKTYSLNIKEVGSWSIPYLASGAVVSSPTLAMIGEGKYDEAVIPLGNSPQMRELVREIADAVKSNGGASDSVPVKIYLDGQVIFDDVIDRARVATTSTGVNPLLGG